jgi:regulator of sigma E protease
MEALATLGHFLLTVVIGLLVLTVLVYVHELGHYLVAKRFGMRVNAFAIFMGGVRKTDLHQWLERPLLPSKWVWGAFAASFLAAVVGALAKLDSLYLAGLLGAGVAVPLWTMLRLAALYHVPRAQVVGTWLKAIGVAAVVLLLGTRLQGVDANMVVGVATGATLIALALVYYLPVQMREQEDDKQGYGQIEVKCAEDGTTDRLPVRFRPIWSRTAKDGTEFSLLLLPLGGFAAIAGMHAKPDGSEVKIEGGFYSKPPLQRLAVLFAGPLFSILFGVAVLWGLYSTTGKDVFDKRPVIGGVNKGGPADVAGLKPGDEIVSIDGVAVKTFYEMSVETRDNYTKSSDGELAPVPTSVTYRRDGKLSTVTVTPAIDDEPRPAIDENMEFTGEMGIYARLEIGPGMTKERYSAAEALSQAIAEPVRMVVAVASIPLKPKEAADAVAGPTAMAKVTSAVVKEGAEQVLWYAAMLSLSLGVMNLLPIVPLDGGQMVVAFVEMLRGGRRLSIQVQNMLANSGIALLAILMLAVWAVDLGRNARANESAKDQAVEQSQPK